jgi:hypothetical protein
MTQARAKKPQSKSAAAIRTTKSPAQTPVPVDGERFEVLWLQFEDEAGFTAGRLDDERTKLQEEIVALEAKIAEKKAALEAVESRVDAAKQQMRMLLSARLSDDAILSAMRVEYKVKRAVPKAKKEPEVAPAADTDKQFVLDQLDAEGLSVPDLRKLTGKDARYLRATLESLVADGKVAKTGDRATAKYHLA